MRYDTISFLSDYGRIDEFVGVVHSVIRSIAPEVAVLDITHDIAPHDVRAGALALARSVQYLCPGVVLAVVDPGVGTERRAIAVEVADGAAVLIGPDNGLLASAVSICGGATSAFCLDNADYHLTSPGATFAGRDVFAPAAAHLCAGVPLTELGPSIDLGSLQPGIVPLTHEENGALSAEVLWVDHFGNAQLNVDPQDVVRYDGVFSLQLQDQQRVARLVTNYAELRTGEVGLVLDSYGLLAISVNRASAAAELRLAPGDLVTIGPLNDGDAGAGSGQVTPVALRASRPDDWPGLDRKPRMGTP